MHKPHLFPAPPIELCLVFQHPGKHLPGIPPLWHWARLMIVGDRTLPLNVLVGAQTWRACCSCTWILGDFKPLLMISWDEDIHWCPWSVCLSSIQVRKLSCSLVFPWYLELNLVHNKFSGIGTEWGHDNVETSWKILFLCWQFYALSGTCIKKFTINVLEITLPSETDYFVGLFWMQNCHPLFNCIWNRK